VALVPKDEYCLGLGIIPVFLCPTNRATMPDLEEADANIANMMRQAVIPPFVSTIRAEELATTTGWALDTAKTPDKRWRLAVKEQKTPPGPQPPSEEEKEGNVFRKLPGKYAGVNGLWRESVPGLSGQSLIHSRLVNMKNSTLAYRSWKGVKAALSKRDSLARKYEVNLDFPWRAENAEEFLSAASLEGLAPATAKTYLAHLRTAEECTTGRQASWRFSDIKTALRGFENMHASNPRSNPSCKEKTRVPITPYLMRIFKLKLLTMNIPTFHKRVIWCAACWMFTGSLRSGDILAVSTSAFVDGATLRRGDVKLVSDKVNGETVEYLLVTLQKPKEAKGKSVRVELLPMPGVFFCPVQAYIKMVKNSSGSTEDPLFDLGGQLLTAPSLNKILKQAFAGEVDYDEKVSGHSFRAGVTSALARCGASDDLIRSQGRWNSAAYEAYIKLGRSVRLSQQSQVAEMLMELSASNFGKGVLVA
jgi:hypothetical protein